MYCAILSDSPTRVVPASQDQRLGAMSMYGTAMARECASADQRRSRPASPDDCQIWKMQPSPANGRVQNTFGLAAFGGRVRRFIESRLVAAAYPYAPATPYLRSGRTFRHPPSLVHSNSPIEVKAYTFEKGLPSSA